jgi:hypothetical protein
MNLFQQLRAFNAAHDKAEADLWVNEDAWGYEELVDAFGSADAARESLIDAMNTLRVYDHCLDLSADAQDVFHDLVRVDLPNQPEGYAPCTPMISFESSTGETSELPPVGRP